jgi:signal transduction histidine kinase/HAMP domain-containing protein
MLGMRWWLGLAFAAVAALTAVAVVTVLNGRSEGAFRKYAEAFAVGRSVVAAESLTLDSSPAALRRDALTIAKQRSVRLYVFDSHGRLLTGDTSRGVAWADVPMGPEALAAALAGKRYIHGRFHGYDYVVGIPIHAGAGAAIVTYSRQRGMQTALGIIRDEFLQAALIALAVGAALGLVIATLTARRLQRIAGAAKAIGGGDFDVQVSGRFPDEVGSLAGSIERMRLQLQELFLALRRDRDRFEGLLERLEDGVLLVNRNLDVEFANERGRELLNGDGRLVEGAGAHRLAVDLFRTGHPSRLRLDDGGRTLEFAGIPPLDASGNAIVVVHDQSQKERNERVQREFATNAAHELRSPLASIVTAVEMLQTGAKDDPVARDEFLEVSAKESGRLTRLTRALLVLARADARDERPRRGTVTVAPLLEQVAAGLPVHGDVVVNVDCPPSLAVAGDADLLEQAVSSIAANAAQHTDAGSVTIRGRGLNGTVVIEVADTGEGIAQHERGRIFDRFYRTGTRDGGFGLGLSIAREAVGALGGDIDLESQVGVGTTVRITLARAQVPA